MLGFSLLWGGNGAHALKYALASCVQYLYNNPEFCIDSLHVQAVPNIGITVILQLNRFFDLPRVDPSRV